MATGCFLLFLCMVGSGLTYAVMKSLEFAEAESVLGMSIALGVLLSIWLFIAYLSAQRDTRLKYEEQWRRARNSWGPNRLIPPGADTGETALNSIWYVRHRHTDPVIRRDFGQLAERDALREQIWQIQQPSMDERAHAAESRQAANDQALRDAEAREKREQYESSRNRQMPLDFPGSIAERERKVQPVKRGDNVRHIPLEPFGGKMMAGWNAEIDEEQTRPEYLAPEAFWKPAARIAHHKMLAGICGGFVLLIAVAWLVASIAH